MLTTVTRRTIDETIAFHGAQYAPPSGEWETFEAHSEAARVDGERRWRSFSRRGPQAIGICLPGFSGFSGREAGLHPGQYSGDMGSHVASSELQRKCHGCGQASQLARSKDPSCP